MDKMGIHYNVWIVLLSFVLAATVTYSALNLISQVSRSTGKIRRLWLISGACVLGCGIWAIHYVGIMANRFPAEVNYYPGRSIISLLVGVLFCYLAFRITSVPQLKIWNLVVGGILLGSGFSAMHYIGMSSMKIATRIHYDIWIQAVAVILVLVSSYIGLLMFHKFKECGGFQRWKLYSALFIGFSVTGLHYTSVKACHFEYNNLPGSKPFL